MINYGLILNIWKEFLSYWNMNYIINKPTMKRPEMETTETLGLSEIWILRFHFKSDYLTVTPGMLSIKNTFIWPLVQTHQKYLFSPKFVSINGRSFFKNWRNWNEEIFIKMFFFLKSTHILRAEKLTYVPFRWAE